ncbi:MAG: tRNA (N(6)-L-threonylcarbamoyladenosine(37)-C(2))-methylthiotransferase, partial [Methanobacteriaceae archaeon]
MKFYLETYGCTFNQADSQIMVSSLEKEGYELTESADDADIIILNSCYVKLPTQQKIINRIQHLTSSYPKSKLLVAGCMVDIDPQVLERIAPQASWIGARQLSSILEVVEAAVAGEKIRKTGPGYDIKAGLTKKRSNPLIHILQIAEGCQGSCTYCCTRFARGELQSYPVDVLLEEVRRAVGEGCVEIQLTAQDTAAYGKDTQYNLSSLIKDITEIEGDFRLRVGMMHPQSIGEDLESLINSYKNEKVYQFLHLPLQSGNDQVLSHMKRGHTVETYKEIVHRFREAIPGLSLATDVIVGYPTEDEKAFKDTMEVISELRPDFLHISKYHHRPGAVSSNLTEISAPIMKSRARQLNELKTRIAYQNNQ